MRAHKGLWIALVACLSLLALDKSGAFDDKVLGLTTSFADARYCRLVGCTMTGPVLLNTGSTAPALDSTVTLGAATGNEVAWELNYTTNKAAGNDTGLLINFTDTASPGTSQILRMNTGGAQRFLFSSGGVFASSGTISSGGNIVGGAAGGVQTGTLGVTSVTAATDLLLYGNTTGSVYVDDPLLVCDGACPTWGACGSQGDTCVEGRLEVDGAARFDSSVNMGVNLTVVGSVGALSGRLNLRGQDTQGLLVLGSAFTNRTLSITDYDNITKNHDHALQTNPTMFFHSALNPDTNNTRWGSLHHDGTSDDIGSFNIDSGSGPVSITADLAPQKRLLGKAGADVASAADITLGDGNYFSITGTTQTDRILTTGWTAGSRVTLRFADAVVVRHGIAAGDGYAGVEVSGGANYTSAARSIAEIVFDGTSWNLAPLYAE